MVTPNLVHLKLNCFVLLEVGYVLFLLFAGKYNTKFSKIFLLEWVPPGAGTISLLFSAV